MWALASSTDVMLTMFMTALSFLASSVVLSLATVAIYRLLFHPLSRLPGSRPAATSHVWHASPLPQGIMVELAGRLHREYGEVVRVGPNEVWFNSKEAFKAIYSKFSAAELSSQP